MTAQEEDALLLIAETIAKAINECGGTVDNGCAADYALHLFEHLHLSDLLLAGRVLDDRACWSATSFALPFPQK